MGWEQRLAREALAAHFDAFSLLYHVSLRPATPKEYEVPGLVALTFRYRVRPDGRRVFVTTLDPAAALRVGGRIGLDAAEALAMVDSHERVHVALQLEGVPEDVEERHSLVVDAVWLSLRHPRGAAHVRAGEIVVSRVEEGFWEALVDADERE
jgi:hypothetical protein